MLVLSETVSAALAPTVPVVALTRGTELASAAWSPWTASRRTAATLPPPVTGGADKTYHGRLAVRASDLAVELGCPRHVGASGHAERLGGAVRARRLPLAELVQPQIAVCVPVRASMGARALASARRSGAWRQESARNSERRTRAKQATAALALVHARHKLRAIRQQEGWAAHRAGPHANHEADRALVRRPGLTWLRRRNLMPRQLPTLDPRKHRALRPPVDRGRR